MHGGTEEYGYAAKDGDAGIDDDGVENNSVVVSVVRESKCRRLEVFQLTRYVNALTKVDLLPSVHHE